MDERNILIKPEVTYGATAPSAVSAIIRNDQLPLQVQQIQGERRLVGEVNARIECPCCGKGIHIKMGFDQPL